MLPLDALKCQNMFAAGRTIQIILAAVFGLYALVAFGSGTLLKRRSAELDPTSCALSKR